MTLEFIFDDIIKGTKILPSHLTNKGGYIFIQPNNITPQGIEIEQAARVNEKFRKKFYPNLPTLDYGDYLLFRNGNSTFKIQKVELQEKNLLASEDFFILKNPIGYFENAINDKEIRRYFYEKLARFEKQTEGSDFRFLEKIKGIDIPEKQIALSDEPEKYPKFKKEPLDPSKIDFIDDKVPIYNIAKYIKNKTIEMDTDFQRKAGLWKDEEKSRFIESMLIRFPVPSFYFDKVSIEGKESKWFVIDGLQRLTAIDWFLNKGNRLVGLEFLLELEGKSFENLPFNLQTDLETYNIRVVTFTPDAPKSVKYSLFERLNTSGYVLTSQEIRHAINSQPQLINQITPAEYLKKLASMDSFKKIWGEEKTDRMEDREFILRFLSFHLAGYKSYHPPMKDFLNKQMPELYNYTPNHLEDTKSIFDNALKLIVRVFGTKYDEAFKTSSNVKLNLNLLEVVCCHFAELDDKESQKLRNNRTAFLNSFEKLKENELFKQSITSEKSGTVEGVHNRFQEFSKILQQHIS